MPLNAAALDLAGEAIAAAAVGASLHTGDPGAAGTSNVIAGGRVAIDLDSTNGNLTLATPAAKTGLTPAASVAFIGLWTTSTTGGTYLGSVPRTTGDPAVNASGEYTIETLSIPATAT